MNNQYDGKKDIEKLIEGKIKEIEKIENSPCQFDKDRKSNLQNELKEYQYELDKQKREAMEIKSKKKLGSLFKALGTINAIGMGMGQYYDNGFDEIFGSYFDDLHKEQEEKKVKNFDDLDESFLEQFMLLELEKDVDGIETNISVEKNGHCAIKPFYEEDSLEESKESKKKPMGIEEFSNYIKNMKLTPKKDLDDFEIDNLERTRNYEKYSDGSKFIR